MLRRVTMTDRDPAQLVAGKYAIEDLVDLGALAHLFKKFTAATGFTTGFLAYPSQRILIKTGWRDACVKFHRACPATLKFCKVSNVELSRHLKQHRELSIRHCRMGLVDGATPVIVRGVYIAYLSTGQVFFQPPNLDRYRKIARQFGFDPPQYLRAIQAVPVVAEARFRAALSYLSELATLIAEQGLLHLETQEQTARLRDSEKRFRDLFESSRDAIMINEPPTWKFTAGNLAAVQMFGAKTEAEFLAQAPWELSPARQPDGRASSAQARAMLATALRKGAHFFEWTHRRLNGAEFQADVLLTKMKRDGKVIVQGTVRDITDRKRAEHALRQSEARLRFALQMIQTGAWELDLLTHTAHRTLIHDQIFGYPTLRPRWTYKLFLKHVLPADRPEVDRRFRAAIAAQTDWNFECRIRRTDGAVRWIWAVGGHEQNPAGNSVRISGIVQDITERKQLEMDIQRVSEIEKQRLGRDLHDGLGQQLVALRYMARNLEAALAQQALPAAGAAARIARELEHAAKQTHDLARGLLPVELQHGGLVVALHKLAGTTANLCKLNCRVSIPRKIQFPNPEVAGQLYRIAQEAINNAVKHSHGQTIRVKLVRQRGRIVLTVRDDGVGISKKTPQSTAMGLRIMRYRAGILNAQLTVARAPGGGTLVTCTVTHPNSHHPPARQL